MKTFRVAAAAATGAAAAGALETLGAIGAAGACTGFTVTYYGALACVVATGLEAITGSLWTFYSDFCCKTFS